MLLKLASAHLRHVKMSWSHYNGCELELEIISFHLSCAIIKTLQYLLASRCDYYSSSENMYDLIELLRINTIFHLLPNWVLRYLEDIHSHDAFAFNSEEERNALMQLTVDVCEWINLLTIERNNT